MMGVEANFQALPADCALLQRAKENAAFAEKLASFSFYARLPASQIDLASQHQWRGDAEFSQFALLLKATVAENPGIESRNCTLDRRWDIVDFMLRAAYGDEKWIEHAVKGDPGISPDAKSVQGFPLRFLAPAAVSEVALWFSEIDLNTIRTFWNPSEISHSNLYKSQHCKTEDWEWIEHDVENLRSFYAQAARHSEGVLAVYD